MLIGALSDSHGRVAVTARAVSLLRARGCDVLLHLGDVETEAVLDELAGHPARVVFGNCDFDPDRLERYAELLGITVDHPMGVFDADGARVAFTHGHIASLLDEGCREADYVFHGHSHELRDERVGRARVINPGALFRATRYTCAVLDTRMDALEIIEIEKSGGP
jgi:putative phosphoesterase